MAQFAPRYISQNIQKLKPEQIEWYLTRGEPQAIEATRFTDGEIVSKFYPGLRGIVVGKECENPEEALAEATKAKEQMLKKDLEVFDEVEHGMDTEALELQSAFDEALVRIERIAHIGTMQDGSISEVLEGMIEDMDIDDSDNHRIPEGLEFLANYDDVTRAEEIVEVLRDYGMVGFLIEASVPSRTYRDNGSASIHYGTRYTKILYGSTYSQACKRALAWAEKLEDEMRSKQLQGT